MAIRQFWKWAAEEGYVDVSPAMRLRYPKVPRRTPDLLPLRVDTQLLNVARTARDRLALAILLDLGVRKSELGALMVRDLDLGRRILTVFGKGQKERILPVRGRLVLMAEEYLLTELPEFPAISNGERTRVRRTPESDDHPVPGVAKGGEGSRGSSEGTDAASDTSPLVVRAPTASRSRGDGR